MFNYAKFIARNVHHESRSFSGIQVITSGDFFQLQPAPRYDVGNFAFQSKLWDVMFSHTFAQNSTVPKGTSVQFANSLARRVHPEDFGVDYISEIYAANDEVDFSNFVHLKSVDAILQTWRPVDSGDRNILNR